MLVERDVIASDAAGRVLEAALRLRTEIAAIELRSALHWLDVCVKANFDPNQPRTSAGHGRLSGRWVKPPGPANVIDFDKIIDRLPTHLPPEVVELLRQGPPIPVERPPSFGLRTPHIKALARVLLKAGARLSVAGDLVMLIEAAHWIHEYAPLIVAYLDPPKKLAELQAGVTRRSRRPGYDIHHIVEENAARDLGFPIDTAIRHRELDSWYERRDVTYDGLTPREYLRGKGWEERFSVGEEGLRAVGVLAP